MKSKDLNVWNWGCTKRYYLTHPWKWLKELKWNINSARQRAVKGYCDSDWMNFDAWFKCVAPMMLRDMADHGHAYPGDEPFDTPEKWHDWLHKMADQLEMSGDEDSRNEYHQPYMDALMANPKEAIDNPDATKEIRDKFMDRWTEIQKENEETFQKTMTEMVKHWNCLWD